MTDSTPPASRTAVAVEFRRHLSAALDRHGVAHRMDDGADPPYGRVEALGTTLDLRDVVLAFASAPAGTIAEAAELFAEAVAEMGGPGADDESPDEGPADAEVFVRVRAATAAERGVANVADSDAAPPRPAHSLPRHPHLRWFGDVLVEELMASAHGQSAQPLTADDVADVDPIVVEEVFAQGHRNSERLAIDPVRVRDDGSMADPAEPVSTWFVTSSHPLALAGVLTLPALFETLDVRVPELAMIAVPADNAVLVMGFSRGESGADQRLPTLAGMARHVWRQAPPDRRVSPHCFLWARGDAGPTRCTAVEDGTMTLRLAPQHGAVLDMDPAQAQAILVPDPDAPPAAPPPSGGAFPDRAEAPAPPEEPGGARVNQTFVRLRMATPAERGVADLRAADAAAPRPASSMPVYPHLRWLSDCIVAELVGSSNGGPAEPFAPEEISNMPTSSVEAVFETAQRTSETWLLEVSALQHDGSPASSYDDTSHWIINSPNVFGLARLRSLESLFRALGTPVPPLVAFSLPTADTALVLRLAPGEPSAVDRLADHVGISALKCLVSAPDRHLCPHTFLWSKGDAEPTRCTVVREDGNIELWCSPRHEAILGIRPGERHVVDLPEPGPAPGEPVDDVGEFDDIRSSIAPPTGTGR